MNIKNILRKNKGFLLLSTYVVIVVLIISAVALFGKSINEHNFATNSYHSLAARYAAERGIYYIINEIKNNSNFVTHDAIYNDSNGKYELIPVASPPEPKMNNVIISNGNYTSNFPEEDAQFIVRAYRDPQTTDETVILSRGVSGSQSRLIVSKYVPSSLYRFFIFTPSDFWPGSQQLNADGSRIHANGSIIFSSGASFNDISELSTAQYYRYYARSMVPSGDTDVYYDHDGNPDTPDIPYTWDEVFWSWRDPWVAPNDTEITELKYYNKYDGLNYGDYRGLLMLGADGVAVPWDGESADTILDPYDPSNFNYYMCANYKADCSNGYNSMHTKINDITIPNKFATTGYDWNKYYILENCYWYNSICFTYPEETITAYHLNTEKQYEDWLNFLATETNEKGETLEGIVKDANTGGVYYEPLSIAGAEYHDAAQEDGIFIENVQEGGGLPAGLYIYINGEAANWTGNQININGIEGVFEKKSFVDVNTAETKEVIVLDISKLKQAYPDDPNAGLDQNIIYSNYPIVLTNASEIPEDGLTTVCEENIYLHGNYNDISDKPSAAISAKDVYTLSSDWNYPQTLEATYHNLNYPYEHDFYCPQGNTNCINNLINNYDRDPDETTHPDYPSGRNWYLDNYQNMANAVDDSVTHIYKIALVGYFAGIEPKVLERWTHYDNPGSLTEPPSDWKGAYREIYGARVKLKNDDFPYEGSRDGYTKRCCNDGIYDPCRDCSQYPGWYSSMTSWGPGGVYNSYFYNTQFENGNVPPGDLVGYTSTVFLELEDSSDNWNYHYDELSLPQN